MTKALPWLWIIGIGDDGLAGLGTPARRLLEAADMVVGGERHLSFLPASDIGKNLQETVQWPTPWNTMVKALQQAKKDSKQVVVLASGDPFWFGAGSLVAQNFDRGEWISIPHASSFQLAAHRLGWALQACTTISLHGRPATNVLQYLGQGGRVLALAESRTAGELKTLFEDKGFGQTTIQVLAHLAGQAEACYDYTSGLTEELVVLAFDLGPARLVAPLSGLPDRAFDHDGQLTKQEVRAATLAKLKPQDGETLWDLGAGCGSIAIEWCRLNSNTAAVAFERDEKRIQMIHNNANKLAAYQLEICAHDVSQEIDKPAPQAIFIGGGLSATLLERCWHILPAGGRLVANAVTLESENLLNSFPEKIGLNPSDCLSRLAVERPIKVGNKYGWKPFMTVTQLAVTK